MSEAFDKPGHFLPSHQCQFGFRRFTFEQGAIVLQVGDRFQITFALCHQLLEPGVFTGQFLGALRVVKGLGLAQCGFNLRKAFAESFNVRTQVHLRYSIYERIGAGRVNRKSDVENLVGMAPKKETACSLPEQPAGG